MKMDELEKLWNEARASLGLRERLVLWADAFRPDNSVPALTWAQVTAPELDEDEEEWMVPVRTSMGRDAVDALRQLLHKEE